MDLKSICSHIYYAVVSIMNDVESPVSYIKVTLGKKFQFTEEELLDAFKLAKWDTSISTADLNVSYDENLDCILRIDEITDFFDEDGKCNTYKVSESDAIIG